MKNATIGMRFLAMVVDGIVLSVLYIITGMFTNDLRIQAALEVIFMFLYYGFCEGSMGATLGKKLCRIKVVDENGNKITMGIGFFRSFGRLISAIILGIGYIIALFDENNRSLHDRIAHTRVVEAASVPLAAPTPVYAPPVHTAIQEERAQLVGIAGFYAGRAFDIPASGVVMGRDPTTCGFVLPDNIKGVSRNHCKLEYNPTTKLFILHDLGSSYGTFKGNGEKISQGQPAALPAEETFYLASKENLFKVTVQ